MIIRTSEDSFRVPYLKDQEGNIYCLDEEGAPLKTV